MRKLYYLAIAILACAVSFVSCKEKEEIPDQEGGKVAVAKIVAAASDFYGTWEDERTIPNKFTIDGQEFTLAQFIQAEASALVAVAGGKTDDIAIGSPKEASNPDKDSYDKKEIAVTNGEKDGKGVPEDLVTIASTILSKSAEAKQIPNQTIIYRGTTALAFSTDRATVTIARALAAYAVDGKVPTTVETEYLSASTTLKAFAQEFVKYLDVWEANVCDRLSADGSACEDNNNPLERVHFIPIPNDSPSDSWTKQGLQYDTKYQPYHTVTIEGTTYTAAQCWEIAIRGLMNLCTTTGEEFLNNHSRNGEIPYGNGMSLTSAPISKPSAACIWGMYPWYEYVNQGNLLKYNSQEITEIGLEPIMKCTSWHVVRSFISNANNSPLGKIGNYQEFGTGSGTLNLEGYEGLISPMREFLVLARFYKYMLDNNINSNVYDALKNVKVDFDLYKQSLPITLKADKLTFEATPDGAKALEFTATDSWTASTENDWIHLDKASGAAGEVTINVTVDNYTVEEARTGEIVVATSDYSKTVSVTQNAYVKPVTGTLEDFAKAFVTLLPVWEATVGEVDADSKHNGATAWTNVHFLPISSPNPGYTREGNQYDAKWQPYWSAKVGENEFTSNQCWEIAIRGLMNLCTTEGEAHLPNMVSRNNNMYTLGNGVSLDSPMPSYSSSNKWGANPWYEADGVVTYNGAAIEEVGVAFILKCCSWHVVRGLIKNSGNSSPLGAIGNYQEFGTNTGSTLVLDGYVGQISAMRELIILARIYKYILDNNIKTNVYDAIKDVKFDFDMYHQVPSIKQFAQSFVTCLDVWQNTVGTVDADGKHNGATAFTNVHLLPIINPSASYTNAGNQYDQKYAPFWSAKVGKFDFSSNQCWEMAIRGLMDLCTTEGDEFLTDMTDRNKAYTLANGVKMSAPVPMYSANNKWNSMPWYEEDANDKTVTYNGEAIDKVGIEFLLKCGSWHVVRGLIKNAGNNPLNGIGNFQQFGTVSSTLNLEGYSGYVAAMRELLIAARIYKYILDNNIEENVYDAIKNAKVDFALY